MYLNFGTCHRWFHLAILSQLRRDCENRIFLTAKVPIRRTVRSKIEPRRCVFSTTRNRDSFQPILDCNNHSIKTML